MDKKDVLILLVDDENANVRLLRSDLEDAGYSRFLVARDGVEAWGILEKNHRDIDVVLLDRMMPNMNGMEVMAKIKAHPDMQQLPVIMQTAAASKEQMLEGIAAGVYYYLTKPYDEETLVATVEAAVRDHAAVSAIRKDPARFSDSAHLVTESWFRARTLEDASSLGAYLAGLFPDPERVVTGITELLINAIEHGNLGISYEEKSRLVREGDWHDEIARRLALPEHSQKYAEAHYRKGETEIFLGIKDCGKGFDWEKYLDIDPERALHHHGRGIAMAKIMSFDSMEYQGCGNEIHCRVSW
ncbi:MAG: response regulator [Rickettsiales bacterium]